MRVREIYGTEREIWVRSVRRGRGLVAIMYERLFVKMVECKSWKVGSFIWMINAGTDKLIVLIYNKSHFAGLKKKEDILGSM